MPSTTLQDTGALLPAFFNNNPLPSFIVSARTLQIVAANKKAASLLQYSAATLQSLALTELMVPKDGAAFELVCRQQGNGQAWSYPLNLLKGGGEILMLNGFISAYTEGGAAYLQVVATPLPEMRAQAPKPPGAEDGSSCKIKLMASLVTETEDILTAADLHFKPVSWNGAAERIFGLTSSQAIGSDIGALLSLQYVGATRQQVRDVIEAEGHWRGEMTFIRLTDGKRITLIISFKKLHDERHQHIGYLIFGTDISERKEDELKLKEIEHRFRGVADAAPVGIWMSDTANRLMYVNKPLLDFAGLPAEAFTNAAWAAQLHPDDVEKTKAKFKKNFWQKRPVKLIYRFRNSMGEYRWVQDSGMPRFLEDGTFVGYIGSIVDITETKKREEKLQQQALVLQSVQDIVLTTDMNFMVSSWNKTAENVYGRTEAEALGRYMLDLIDFDFIDTHIDVVRQELFEKGLWKGEVTVKNSNGENRYLLFTVSFVKNKEGQRTGAMAVGRDITERKKAAEKLERSELFYRNLISGSLDGILLCNAQGSITFVAPSVKNILGYDAADLLGHNCFEFVHPDDFSWAMQSYQREVVENPEIKSIVVRLKKKDGGWLWCMVRGNNLLANPHINSMVIYFHDDTLRKQANEALKESEKRFRSLVGDLQVGVMLTAPDGSTIMCNRTMCQMLMVKEEELLGKSIFDVLPDDYINEEGAYLPIAEQPLPRVIRTKSVMKDVVLGFRQRITNERIWVLINADPILNDKGELQHVICTVKEITDRKKLEQELLEKQISHQKALTQATIDGQEKERREIGKELHDNIGQQLTTTKLFLDMAKTTADDGTAEMISLALKGISDVINEIRSISHALVPPILGDIGVIESIEAMLETIRYTQLLKVDFDYFDFNEDRVPENVQLTLYRIIQEGMNNIIKHADATHVNITIKNKNRQLTLELKDNGKGFNGAKVRRGLGLTNIKNRTELFGGTVSIESAHGAGCSLKVVIPDAGVVTAAN